MADAEETGELVADAVTSAIDAAQEHAEDAAKTAEQIADAAMENERGRRIADAEREIYECKETIWEMAQGLAALTLGQTELAAKLDLLTQLQLPPPPVQAPVENEVLINPEPEVIAPEAPPAPEVAPQSPPRKRARFL